MTTVQESVARRVSAARPAAREDAVIRGDVDVEKLVLDVAAKGIPGVRIEDSIISGDVNRTINGASTVTITVHDTAREILRSGRLVDDDGHLRAIDIKLDGLWFRLVKLTKGGDDLNLTFEERSVARLRMKKGPRKAALRKTSASSKKGVTRAQYILQLIRAVKAERIQVKIHELNKVQDIAAPAKKRSKSKRQEREERDEDRKKGFDSGARPGGLNRRQLERVETALTVAERLKASELATLAMLVAMAGESDFGENVGSRGTTFQTLMIPESELATQAYHFLKGGRSFLTGGAIGYAKANPSASPGLIASKVEISDAGAGHYDRFRGVAKAILEAWGGATGAGGGGGTSYRTKPYQFKVTKGETYWDAIQRMAGEVGWRAFFSGGRFYYISEEDLFKSRARFRISEDRPGVSNIDFDWDYRKKVSKATVSCRVNRWSIPPGTVVIVEGSGPADGRWLVESVSRSLFSAEATVALKKPMRERGEPKNEERRKQSGADGVETSGTVDVSGGAKGIVDDLVRIAIAAGGSGVYVGSRLRDGDKLPSGQPSDHADNDSNRSAADIGVQGINLLTGPPSPKLDLAIVAIGKAIGRDYGSGRSGPFQSADNVMYNGYRIQIIWRTTQWGGHMGHIHVGVLKS